MENRTLIAIPLMMGLVLLQPGCGIFGPGTRLEPSELCSDHSDDAIPTFEDATLAEATLDAVNRSEETPFLGSRVVHNDLTCDLVSWLTELDASSRGGCAVERRSRKAERLRDRHDRLSPHCVGPQHLVLHLHLVQRIEEAVALEELSPHGFCFDYPSSTG